MTAMPSGLVAAEVRNCEIIVWGSQFDQTYWTLGPRSFCAWTAPLYTFTAKTPPCGPPGKNTIFTLPHHLSVACTAGRSGGATGGAATTGAGLDAAAISNSMTNPSKTNVSCFFIW